MKFTVNPEVNNKPNSDGKYSVFARITFKRKSKRIKLGFSIKMKYWKETKGTNRRYISTSCPLERRISKAINEYHFKIHDYCNQNENASLSQVINNLNNVNNACFIAFGRKVADKIRIEERVKTFKRYNSKLNMLEKYVNEKELLFSEINKEFVDEYIHWRKTTRKVSDTTLLDGDLKTFKAIFNKAIEYELVEYSTPNPFVNKHLKREPVNKPILTINEMEILKTAKIDDYKIQLALDVFLLSFYCSGARFEDTILLTKDNLHNKDGQWHIEYSMGKNKKNVFIPIGDVAFRIIKSYDSHLLVPVLKESDLLLDKWRLANKLSAANTRINKQLKRVAKELNIETKITCHIARHSYASIALDKGVPVATIKELLEHDSHKTTEKYIKSLDKKKKHEAHLKIIG